MNITLAIKQHSKTELEELEREIQSTVRLLKDLVHRRELLIVHQLISNDIVHQPQENSVSREPESKSSSSQ